MEIVHHVNNNRIYIYQQITVNYYSSILIVIFKIITYYNIYFLKFKF